MVGADLANLANEAALLAARRDHPDVQTADFTDSLEKILLGAPRGIIMSPADRERTAYHEAGHALVGMLTPGADPVRKVSIIPRGSALGVTLSAPDDDQVSYTREDLVAKIRVALGGRVAEEIVFGTITTGAESDIDQATTIARQMIGRWGMSDVIGFVRVLPSDGRGPYAGSPGETSEATQRVLDDEVRQLIDTAHRDVTATLTEQRGRLQTLSDALLEHETLDALDAYAAAPMPPRDPDIGDAIAHG
jgi:cell division protease FtsH